MTNDLFIPISFCILAGVCGVLLWFKDYYKSRYHRERDITDKLIAMLEQHGVVTEIERRYDGYNLHFRYVEPTNSIDNKDVSE